MSTVITGKHVGHERWLRFSEAAYWYFPALALAAACGAAIALGGTVKLVLAFGITAGLILFFAPVQPLIGVFVVLVFLVVGPIASIGGFKQATWIPYLFALILLVRAPIERYYTSRAPHQLYSSTSARSSPLMWVLACYFGLLTISTVVNAPPPLQVLVGAKMYVFIWGVFFLLVVSSISPQFLERIWKGVLLIAVLQLPFALYQRLFVVPRRPDYPSVTALDAIVGTLPGTETGGASGALVMLCVFAIALALCLRKEKVLSAFSSQIAIIAALVTIMLGEVKVVIVLLPVALIVLKRREIVRRPLHFLGMAAIVVALAIGIFALNKAENKTFSQHFEASFGYVLDPNEVHAHGEVGRIAALDIWYRDPRRTPQSFLLGYGPAASQYSSIAAGDVASRYFPYWTNATTAAALLWDVGVLGLASFLAIVVAALYFATRLSGAAQVPLFHRGVLEACAVLFALVGVSIPYNTDLLLTPQFQVLFLLALLQVVYWQSREGSNNVHAHVRGIS